MQRFKPLNERPVMRRLVVDIPVNLYQRLKDLSTNTHITIKSYIINWIEHGLAKEDTNERGETTIEEIRRRFE